MRWALYGIRPGDALTACLRGELFSAVFRLDSSNLEALRDIACFIYWDMPRDSHGNPEVSFWTGLASQEPRTRLVGWDPFKHQSDEQVRTILRMVGDSTANDLESLTDEECASRIQSLRATTEGTEK